MIKGNKVLGGKIKLARKAAGITQEKMAEQLGISPLHYGRLERAERRISLEQIESISRILRVSPYTLLEGCFKGYPQPTFQQTNTSDILKYICTLLVNCSPKEQALCYDICERIVRGE